MNKKIILALPLALLLSNIDLSAMTAAQMGQAKAQIEQLFETENSAWTAATEKEIVGLIEKIEKTKLQKRITEQYRIRLAQKLKSVGQSRQAGVGQQIVARRAIKAEDEAEKLKGDLAAAEEESAGFEKDLADREKEVAELQRSLAQSQHDADELSHELVDNIADTEKLSAALEQEQARAFAMQQALEQRLGQAAQANQAQQAGLFAELQKQDAQLGEVHAQYQQREQALLTQYQEGLKRAEDFITQQQQQITGHQQTIERLSRQAGNAAQVKALTEQLARYKLSNEELKKQRALLAKQLADAEKEAAADAKKQEAARANVKAQLQARRAITGGSATGSAAKPAAGGSAGSGVAAAAGTINLEAPSKAPGALSEITMSAERIKAEAIRIARLKKISDAEKTIFINEVSVLYHELPLSLRPQEGTIFKTFVALKKQNEAKESIDSLVATADILLNAITTETRKKIAAKAQKEDEEELPASASAASSTSAASAGEQFNVSAASASSLTPAQVKSRAKEIQAMPTDSKQQKIDFVQASLTLYESLSANQKSAAPIQALIKSITATSPIPTLKESITNAHNLLLLIGK